VATACIRMGSLIQVRDVPDDVHRTLKARAAREGVSLSEYLRTELQRVAEAPTAEELLARLQARRPVKGTEASAQALSSVRNERA
jgi:plasmid stability protein